MMTFTGTRVLIYPHTGSHLRSSSDDPDGQFSVIVDGKCRSNNRQRCREMQILRGGRFNLDDFCCLRPAGSQCGFRVLV